MSGRADVEQAAGDRPRFGPARVISRSAGFTLLEVLVALTILAVAVVAALQLFGGGLRLARASADHMGAVIVASARLSELGTDALEEGVVEGTEGEYRWVRRVALDQELNPVTPTRPELDTVRIARVSVVVEWGPKPNALELVTLRTWGTQPR